MKRQVFSVFLTAVALTACQDEQTLPFEASTAAASKTISSGGGTLSTAAGASLIFPSGSLSSSTNVTITPTTPSSIASGLGVLLAKQSMAITPAGQQLNVPAHYQVTINKGTADAHLGVLLLESAGAPQVIANASLDLTNGILQADISKLGTLTPIVPPASARFPVTKVVAASAALLALDLPANLALNGVKTISKNCGGFTFGGVYIPCPGLSASASQNVIDKFGDLTSLFPIIAGSMALSVDPSVLPATVSGSINASSTYRMLSNDGATATTIDLFLTIAGTTLTRATQVGNVLTMTNVAVTKSWTGQAPTTTNETLVFNVSGSTATVSESRTVDLGNGQFGTVSVTLAFDITTY